jgi:hypothetical protein
VLLPPVDGDAGDAVVRVVEDLLERHWPPPSSSPRRRAMSSFMISFVPP